MDETPKPTGPDLIVRQQAGEVFTAFLRVGLTAFGGPAAQISTIRREFVERRGWLADAAFADLLAFSLVLPGSAGVQLGMAVGLRCGGLTGLIAAGACRNQKGRLPPRSRPFLLPASRSPEAGAETGSGRHGRLCLERVTTARHEASGCGAEQQDHRRLRHVGSA